MQSQIIIETNQPAPLSNREWEILSLLAEDLSNAQIARRLVISQNTVKVHLQHIFEKLKVQTRLGAVLLALRQGWLTLA